MPDARPIAVQVTATVTALVYPEPEAGGFSASVPALPGCHTEGETLDEVRGNLRGAAEAWLAAAHDHATAIHPRTVSPEPSSSRNELV